MMMLEFDRRVTFALCGAFLVFGILTFAAGLATGVAMTGDALQVRPEEAARPAGGTGAPVTMGEGDAVPLRQPTGDAAGAAAEGAPAPGAQAPGAGVPLAQVSGAQVPLEQAPEAPAPEAPAPEAPAPEAPAPEAPAPEAPAPEAPAPEAPAPPEPAASPAPEPAAAAPAEEAPEQVAPMLVQDRPALIAARMPARPFFSVQVGAFLSEGNARQLLEALDQRGYDVTLRKSVDGRGRMWFYVQSGGYDNYSAAAAAKERLGQRERINGIIVQVARTPDDAG